MQQHEVFKQKLAVRPPPNVPGPRLWVRRLAIWDEPGGRIIRNIQLRRGLNIIWTPDDQGIGHGGGKTLFCRLLRYCLGEERFADGGQRDRIAMKFPEGVVGAEVMLDGSCWAILRPLGSRRRHLAAQGKSLEDLHGADMHATGIEPFVKEVETRILTEELAAVVPGHRQGQSTWPIALAWLTRDQECRFDAPLDWRSPASASDSPARGLNRTETLEALRAFLGAITPEEQSIKSEISELEEKIGRLEQEAGHERWGIDRLRKRLLVSLNVSEDALTQGPIGIGVLREAAQLRVSRSAGVPNDQGATEVESVRADYEMARERVVSLERRIDGLSVRVPEINKIIAQLDSEYPGLSYAFKEAESFPCPICEVPVDRVLASQCKLSKEIPDVDACRLRLARNRESLEAEKQRLKKTQQESDRAKQELAIAQQQASRLHGRLRRLEDARDQQSSKWYESRRTADEVEHLAKLMEEQELADRQLDEYTTALERLRGKQNECISAQRNFFDELSLKFDGIVKRIVGDVAAGNVVLTGNGLKLSVQLGGDRSTSAIDSLKVIAFDLAALCRSIEGATQVPAFLVHDSPREADLGLPLYERLFEFAHWLESVGDEPLFQYLVTTTTRPPKSLSQEPWLRLALHGSPASERLLQCDL